MKVLIAGCGWLGRALGADLVADGHRVIGVRRSAEGLAALPALGIEPLELDLAAANDDTLPAALDAIVACQAAGGGTAQAYRRAYVDATQRLLDHAARSDARVAVVGSTGVFGQTDGGDVDESTPVQPVGETAEVLARSEELVSEAARSGVAVTSFR